MTVLSHNQRREQEECMVHCLEVRVQARPTCFGVPPTRCWKGAQSEKPRAPVPDLYTTSYYHRTKPPPERSVRDCHGGTSCGGR